MADPAHPTVPNAPGVPPVDPPPQEFDANGIPVTNDTNTITVVGRKTSDSPEIARETKTQWGIFKSDGSLALQPDNIREIDDTKEWNVPRYPLEGGGFQSYNKVETPREIHMIVTKSGTQSDKQIFLNAVDALTKSLELLTIVTPEQSFRNMNLMRNSKNRNADAGVGLLSLELSFVEARISATAAFTDVKAPSGADNVNGGAVQTQTPQAAQNPGVDPQ